MYLLTIMILTLVLPLILISAGIRRKLLPYAAILQSLFAMVVAFVLLFGFAWATGEPLGDSLMEEIQFSVDQMIQNPGFLEMLGLSEVGPEEARATLLEAYGVLINLLPSTIISWVTLLSYFYYLFLSSIKRRMGREVLMLPSFASFSLPRKAIYGSMLIYGLSWVTVMTGIVTEDTLILNVRGLIEFAFALQGVAVVFYTMRGSKLQRVMGIFISMIMFTSSFGRIFLALLGFFDLLVSLRQRLGNK